MTDHDAFYTIRHAVIRMQSAASKLPANRWPICVEHINALAEAFEREAAARQRMKELPNVVS